MALVFMEKGGICHVSDEDYEVASKFRWRKKSLMPSGRVTAWCAHQANGRRFDLFLHRLIAVRMDPKLGDRHEFRVEPIDGDFLNCRRENLEITIRRPKRPGPATRPGGTPLRETRRRRPKPYRDEGDLDRLWNPGKWLPTTRKFKSRPGSRSDGPAGPAMDRDPR